MEFSGYDLESTRPAGEPFRARPGVVDLENPRRGAVGGAAADDGRRPADPRLGGTVRKRNVATGYSMLGMTVSQPAGEAMAEMVVTGPRPELFEAFRIDASGGGGGGGGV